MALLRRVLYLDALLLAMVGVLALAAPRFTLVTLFGQPQYIDYAPIRLLGVAGIALAMLMVLVGHRVEDLWWWCWAFVALEAGTAAVATLHAAFGLPRGATAWPWWALALGSWVLAGAFLWGIARAGQEVSSE
jgi:hypothetical protein